MGRARLRDLGITIGHLPTGPHNAITDVPGVRVGMVTIIRDEPATARTGVTMILPNEEPLGALQPFAGFHSFNGYGEMTGSAWIEESGLLSSPIGITNTHQVGLVHDAIIAYAVTRQGMRGLMLPVAAETFDGRLNDLNAQTITHQTVFDAIDAAKSGPVAEGNVGGGTGMICHGFKGGTGTSSRVIEACGQQYMVGCLVQANYGGRSTLRLNGIPIGELITEEEIPSAWTVQPRGVEGSIIGIIATDAPLLPVQCKRLARRCVTGLARTGGVGNNGSGDLFLAFANGNAVRPERPEITEGLRMLPHAAMDPFFEAVAQSMEESIWNALTSAETMTGLNGHMAQAIPLERLVEVARMG